jgi:hypothetical protein
MGNADYRKNNDRSLNSSTYHKKDGTPMRSILKEETRREIMEEYFFNSQTQTITPDKAAILDALGEDIMNGLMDQEAADDIMLKLYEEGKLEPTDL